MFAITLSVSAAAFFLLSDETFTPEKWAEAGRCDGLTDWECVEKDRACLRRPMVRSLIRKHLVPGTDRATVLSLLGEASGTMHNRPECFEWSLGTCGWMAIDESYLRVCFDESGYVAEAY